MTTSWEPGIAWLPNAPDVKLLQASAEMPDSLTEEVIQHAERAVTTLNLALSSFLTVTASFELI